MENVLRFSSLGQLSHKANLTVANKVSRMLLDE